MLSEDKENILKSRVCDTCVETRIDRFVRLSVVCFQQLVCFQLPF